MPSFSAFPGSCAVNVLSGFTFSHNHTLDKHDLGVIDQKNGNKAINLIVLNQEQMGGTQENQILEKGYVRVIDRAFHPNHSSFVSLYARVNYPNKSTPRSPVAQPTVPNVVNNTEEIRKENERLTARLEKLEKILKEDEVTIYNLRLEVRHLHDSEKTTKKTTKKSTKTSDSKRDERLLGVFEVPKATRKVRSKVSSVG